MSIAEIGWLEAAGQAAGVILIIELMVLILITTVLVIGIAYALYYIHNKVVPLLTRLAPAVEQRLQATDRTSVKVAERVIDLHARTEAVKATVRTLIGRNGHQALPPGREGPRLERPTPNAAGRLPGTADGQGRLPNPTEGR